MSGVGNRHGPAVVHVPLAIGIGRPLRVALIGDIHFDPFFEVSYLERVVMLVNALAPDLILHTGDFVSHTAARLSELHGPLHQLTPRLGHMAILGNHDQWIDADRVEAMLTRAGIDLLRNRRVPLPGTADWFVTGLESYWAGRPDTAPIADSPAASRHLVLVHEPDAFDHLADARCALQLSGHTHGGQIRVPGYGAISLPRWGKRYQMGRYAVGGRQLYVHRGLGTVDDHVRLNCPPEITLLTLS